MERGTENGVILRDSVRKRNWKVIERESERVGHGSGERRAK